MRIRGVNKLPPKLAVFFVILACSILPGCSQDPPRSSPIAPSPKTPEPTPPSLVELRAHAPTRLIRNGPSPAPSAPSQVPPGVIEVTYPSGDLELKAWLAFPDDERDAHPAVVYFHSGFALGPSDLEEARVFLDAGFAVLMPMLRGENGNPGDFELFWGEVDDAVAAVNWLAERDDISRDHIFTFGHSIGGGISAMLSLVDGDVPIRHGGSCGGLYVPKIFDQWLDIVPFDASKSEERSLRTLVGHTKSMRREHHAYLGIGDPLAESRQQIRGSKLHQQLVLGDHLSSLRPSLTDYAKLINQQVFGDSRPLPESLQPISWKHPESIPVDAVFEDSAKPEQWDVNNDPFSGELRFFRGEVRCPITIVVRETYPNQRGDFLSPRGFEPVAKLTQHPKAGGFPSGLIDLSTMLVTKNHRGAFFETLSGNLYGFNGRKGFFGVFWPGTEDTVGYPPDEMSRKVWSEFTRSVPADATWLQSRLTRNSLLGTQARGKSQDGHRFPRLTVWMLPICRFPNSDSHPTAKSLLRYSERPARPGF